jgi:uncharacterized cupin superfamily protein
VNPTRSEIHVFKGEVALHKASESIKVVKEGQAISFAAGSQLLAANLANFASLNQVNARAELSDRVRFERWQAQSAGMNSDPSLQLHFYFQDGESSRSLRNRAPLGEDGSIVGTAWTGGRWPGKGAL